MFRRSPAARRTVAGFRTWEVLLWAVVLFTVASTLAMSDLTWPPRPGATVARAHAAPVPAPAAPAAAAAATPAAAQVGATLAATKAAGQASADVQGYVDTIRREGGDLVIQGWAADTKNPEKPLTIAAFAGEAPLGSASVSVVRADVAAYLKIPESSLVAYGITSAEACPAGEPLTLVAIADDKRFAVLLPSGDLKLVCP